MAAAEEKETAGEAAYQDRHMDAIFKQGLSFSGYERDLLCLNLGSKKFLDISGISGADSISDGRGAVFADLDNDGDLDIFLTALQGEGHHLFRNNVGSLSGFLRVSLEGTESGRDAYGTIVRVTTSTGTLTKIKSGGSGYLSQWDPRLLFGLGDDEAARSVEVRWPSGRTRLFENVPAGSSLHVVEGKDRYEPVAETRFSLPDPYSAEETLVAKLGFSVGGLFPEMKLRTLEGDEASLRDLVKPGSRYLVNLWATYCVPCGKEMPELQRLYPRLTDAGVKLVGLSLDTEAADVREYLDTMGIDYPVYLADPESIDRVFARGEVMIPLSVVLDGKGRALEVLSGWTDRSRRHLEALAGSSAPSAVGESR